MWRITIAVLILLVSANVYSSDEPNLKSTDGKHTPKSEERGSDSNPITIKIIPSPDAQTKATQEEGYRKEKSVQDERLVGATELLVGVTAILAIFTGGLWYATYSLARETRSTAAQQARDMETSLSLSQQSADAAKISSFAIAETAKAILSAQRPYVYVVDVVQSSEESLLGPRVGYAIVNYGQIPAIIRFMCVGVATSEGAEPDDHPIQIGPDHEVSKDPLCLPHLKRELCEPHPIGMAFPTNKELFFRIVIHYRGPFSVDEYESVFCWRYDGQNFVPLRSYTYTT